MATVATGTPGGIWTIRVERVDAVQRSARERYGDHGQRRLGRDRPAEVRRHAGAADDHAVAKFPGAPCELERGIGRAMHRKDPRVASDLELAKHFDGGLHDGEVGVAPHQDEDLLVAGRGRAHAFAVPHLRPVRRS
jgi:hypothetical protein